MLPLLLGLPAFAHAASPTDDTIPDAEEARLSKLAAQTPKLHLPQLRDYLRQKLDVAYEIAISRAVDTDHRRSIELAQKKWLEFYEAQQAVASYNAHGGSFAVPAASQEGIYHLRHRTYTLVTPFLQGWAAAPFTPALKAP